MEGKAYREVLDNGLITSHSLTSLAFKLDWNRHCIDSHNTVFRYDKGISMQYAKTLKPGDKLEISGVFSSAHKGPDLADRWNDVHVYLSVGEAKVIEPGDSRPKPGAVRKATVPAPGGVGDFVGVWSSVDRKTGKQVERIEFQRGGQWKDVNEPAGIQHPYGPDGYKVDGDKLILTMAEFGTSAAEFAEVRWIDENHFEYTILQGMVVGRSLPLGGVYIFTRQPKQR